MEESPRLESQSRPIAGRLEGIGIPDLHWYLCENQRTGLLRVECDGMESALYFEEGRIIFASSSDPDDQLGVHLLRQALVTVDQLEAASRVVHPGHRLGRALMDAGILTPEQLVAGVLAQLKSIVLNLFKTLEGGYYFEEGSLPTDEAITLGIPVRALIIEGIKQIRSQSLLRRNVGGAGTVYGLARDWIEILDGLDLSEGEEQLVERLEAGDRSLEVLCREVYLSSFEIYQILWAFKVLGVVEEKEARITVEHGTYDRIPLVGEGFIEFLLRLSRSGETGVLQANRGSLERTFFLQSGNCVFATSTDPDDGLVSFLLQSGVISLQDREETTKRLLTNKRVGTLLREAGAIDDEDLKEMVRRQLCEIIWDTFAWEDGEFGFVSGELPSQEEITLDLSLEALVVHGLRRLTSWTRIEQGAGGLDAVLELTPDYLEILDATGAGTEEWEVTAALKNPKTLRELCRSSHLADFRVAQIVWSLRLLGGIEAISPETGLAAEEQAEEIAAAGSAVPVEVVDLDQTAEPEATVIELQETEGADLTERAAPDEVEPLAAIAAPEDESGELELPRGGLLAEEPDAETTVLEVHSEDAGLEPSVEADDAEPPAELEPEPAAQTMDAPLSPAQAMALGRDDLPAALAVESELSERGASLEETEEIEEAEKAEPVPSIDERFMEPEETISPAATSVLSREDVEAALADGAPPELSVDEGEQEAEEPLSPAATSFLNREDVEAALSKPPAEELPPLEEEDKPAIASSVADQAAEELPPAESDDQVELDPAVTQVLTRDEIEAALERGGADAVTEPEPAEMELSTEQPELEAASPDGVAAAEPEETGQGVPFEISDPALDDWEVPDDLDELIQRFNAAQRIIYRAVKTEIGAGAANFVRSCCGQIAEEGQHDWNEAELRADGSWDADGLKRLVQEGRISDPWPEYQLVIEKEIESLRLHIGDDRAAELKRVAMEN